MEIRRMRRFPLRNFVFRSLVVIIGCLTLTLMYKSYSAAPRFRLSENLESIHLLNGQRINNLQLDELSLSKVQDQNDADEPTKITVYDNAIIHFDLKGAPPKVTYLKKVFKLIKHNGATGILIEWEDTFPFTGILEENRYTEGYTMNEVREILSSAHKLGLDIIPLVQTFGHLEWILKLEKFRRYRENDMYPQVICLADEDAVALVKEVIRQVIDVHKEFGVKFFHIGADEAFEYGVCKKDEEFIRQQKNNGMARLAVQHLRNIATYVRSLLPNGTRVLAWHDMLKSFSPEVINEYKLRDLIEPVVWDYSETLSEKVPEVTWRALAEVFSTVWGSSAYKGANSPSTQLLDIQHYIKNNKAWLRQKHRFGELFDKFRGLILTGWQRYDHFAVLCELLPIGLPSAVVNLQIAAQGEEADERDLENKVSQALGCSGNILLNDTETFSRCTFPGFEVFNAIHVTLKRQNDLIKEEIFENYKVKGWLSRFNINHNYTQLWYLNDILYTIRSNYASMIEHKKFIWATMERIYHKDTIDEWIYEYVDPILEKLKRYFDDISRLQEKRVFPRRGFEIVRMHLPNSTD